MGKYAEAEPLFRRAVEIAKITIGEGHPDYAAGLRNLASLLEAMDCLDEAGLLFEQSSNIIRQALGDGHPTTRTVAGNHACFLLKHYPDDLVLAELEAIFGPDIGC